MYARSEDLDQTAAICPMLLSTVGERGGDGGESRVFRCKTCMKEFSSFQSLGGHRASHNKTFNNTNDQQSSLSSGSVTKKKTKSHICLICGLEFPMGQALGGHMRKHRNEKETGALVTRCFLPEATATTSTFTTLKKPSSGKRVACSDLGSDSMESTINLKLELGRTIY